MRETCVTQMQKKRGIKRCGERAKKRKREESGSDEKDDSEREKQP